jgi:hypothetical protein
MELREIQKPLKDRYREDPDASKITLKADGSQGDDVMSCSVDIGRAVQAAQAHTGAGGAGTAALLRRPVARCARGLCSAHLPDGGGEHGHRS